MLPRSAFELLFRRPVESLPLANKEDRTNKSPKLLAVVAAWAGRVPIIVASNAPVAPTLIASFLNPFIYSPPFFLKIYDIRRKVIPLITTAQLLLVIMSGLFFLDGSSCFGGRGCGSGYAEIFGQKNFCDCVVQAVPRGVIFFFNGSTVYHNYYSDFFYNKFFAIHR